MATRRAWDTEGQNKTNTIATVATTVAQTIGTDYPQVGDKVWVAVGFDNQSATTPQLSSLAVSGTGAVGAWTIKNMASAAQSSALAAVMVALAWAEVTTAFNGNTVITATLSGNTQAKSIGAIAYSGMNTPNAGSSNINQMAYSSGLASNIGAAVTEGTTSLTVNTGTQALEHGTTGGSAATNVLVKMVENLAAGSVTTSTPVDGGYAAFGVNNAAVIPSGSGAGTFVFTGASSGVTVKSGAGAGSFTFTGTAAGTAARSGGTAGLYTWTGAASGSQPTLPPNTGSGAGTFAFTGAASGAFVAKGAAGGAYGWTGASNGTTAHAGTGAGLWTFTGVASGSAPPVGGAQGGGAGVWAFTGAASGTTTRAGSTTGTYTWAGISSGAVGHAGSGAGLFTFTGAAGGSAPGVGGAEGGGAGTYAFIGASFGTTVKVGSGAGLFTFTGAASGSAPSTGGASGGGNGAYAWSGAASGERQATGSGAGTYTITGFAGDSTIGGAQDVGMQFLYGEIVQFLSGGTATDPYSGDTVYDDWDNPTTVLTLSGGIEPIASDEPLQDGRQSVIVGYRLYLPGAQAVMPWWRALVRGEVFNVDGRPAVWYNPFTGWSPGTVVQVGRTDA